MTPLFSSTLRALSFGDFHLTIWKHSKFTSLGPGLVCKIHTSGLFWWWFPIVFENICISEYSYQISCFLLKVHNQPFLMHISIALIWCYDKSSYKIQQQLWKRTRNVPNRLNINNTNESMTIYSFKILKKDISKSAFKNI